MDNGKKFGPRLFTVFLLSFLVFLGAVFIFFNISVFDYLKFLAGLAFFVFVPGFVILGLLKIEVTRIERVTLSLVLGMVTSALLFRFSGLLGCYPLFFLWITTAFLLFFYRLFRNPPRREDFCFSINRTGVLFWSSGSSS